MRVAKIAERILRSRKLLAVPRNGHSRQAEQEGGCGVVGFTSSVPVAGRHILESSVRMHNRGNGKGGGIAAACFDAEQLGVDLDTLQNDYLLQIALLEPSSALENDIEERFISPSFEVDHKLRLDPAGDYRDFGLEARPPDVVRYFIRPKEAVRKQFAEKHGLEGAAQRTVEDELVYQNSFRLNRNMYSALGSEKRAFVLSHGRDLMVLKIVGYAEQVVQYYGLENFHAKIWMAHQRYPTKGRVWHPAGSHPFVGLNEALVHNGDLANYYGISQYLRQHDVTPLFLTDTEVAALLFDLLHRVYRYPIEYVIEALAPTTELDFEQLPEEKRSVYRAIQASHMHGSPDGPWFFIVIHTDPDNDEYRLIGITDTSMLRPQVFALQEGGATIGLVASEKQAIDTTLRSLAAADSRFRPVADRYWNARGGSHTDGGAFLFTTHARNGAARVECRDKFGKQVTAPPGNWQVGHHKEPTAPDNKAELLQAIKEGAAAGQGERLFCQLSGSMAALDIDGVRWLTAEILAVARDQNHFHWGLDMLGRILDRRYDCGRIKPSVVRQLVGEAIDDLILSVPLIKDLGAATPARRIDFDTRRELRPPRNGEGTLVIVASQFTPEGPDSDANLAVKAFQLGWKRFVVAGLRGQRFAGCGFGPRTTDVSFDIFGSSGDYLASGIDGMAVEVHDSAQDQVGQIMKSGTLVVHGDVGQTFMYGAKGGEAYVMGNAAGRPLINATGSPRVVINGTCLDFLAESFMAGNPLAGGGFVILNGVVFDDRGRVCDLPTPYPGANLFSLASGGAIYVRDPHDKLVEEQLNGGKFEELHREDWELIRPYLERNERYFGISVARDLLTVDGIELPAERVYRKVQPFRLAVLAQGEGY